MIVRHAENRRLVGFIVIGALMFSALADMAFVPYGKYLRLVPVIILPLCSLLNTNIGKTIRRPDAIRYGLVFILLVGLVSSIASVAPILGLMKLGLFAAIVVPLLQNRCVQDALLPGSPTYRVMLIFVEALLLLAIADVAGVLDVNRNPNAIACMALLLTPWKLSQSKHSNRVMRYWARFGIILIALVCILAHSRGAFGALVVTFVVFTFSARGHALIKPIVIGAVLLIFASMLVESNDTIRAFVYKQGQTIIDQTRRVAMEDTLEHFGERPFLGFGFGLSANVQPEHEELVLRTWRMSWFVGEFGNSTIAILGGGGILLLLAFGLFFFSTFNFLEGSFRNVCSSGTPKLLQRSFYASIVGLLAHSQFEGWLLSPLSWISVFFWLYVGIVIRLASGPSTVVSAKESSVWGVVGGRRLSRVSV